LEKEKRSIEEELHEQQKTTSSLSKEKKNLADGLSDLSGKLVEVTQRMEKVLEEKNTTEKRS